MVDIRLSGSTSSESTGLRLFVCCCFFLALPPLLFFLSIFSLLPSFLPKIPIFVIKRAYARAHAHTYRERKDTAVSTFTRHKYVFTRSKPVFLLSLNAPCRQGALIWTTEQRRTLVSAQETTGPQYLLEESFSFPPSLPSSEIRPWLSLFVCSCHVGFCARQGSHLRLKSPSSLRQKITRHGLLEVAILYLQPPSFLLFYINPPDARGSKYYS